MVHVDQVNRNVTIAGVPVGGFTERDLDPILDELAATTATESVVVAAPGLDITVTNAEAGISLDSEAMRLALLDAGRQSNPVSSFSTWVGALRNPVQIEPIYAIDVAVAEEMIRSAPGWVRAAPIEPSFTAASGEFVVNKGVDGEYIDPLFAAEALAAEVAFGASPFSVDVNWSAMAPRFDDEDVAAGLAAAMDLADTDLAVRLNEETAYLGTTTITRWIESTLGDDGLVPVFNEDRVTESLERL
ncbi:MAG: hypothetical protein GY704_17690, partial [Phycisphaeraceae bacterium]|nr:hypothetical protein [Phycisphaeraceae bacterium]